MYERILKHFPLPKKSKEAIHERVLKINLKKQKDEKKKNEKPNDPTKIGQN
jgi:hypothetical protein